MRRDAQRRASLYAEQIHFIAALHLDIETLGCVIKGFYVGERHDLRAGYNARCLLLLQGVDTRHKLITSAQHQ